MLYKSKPTKVVTGLVTFTNGRIWEPETINGNHIYTASILLPKNDIRTNEGVNMAIDNAIQIGQSIHRGHFGNFVRKNLPIHDGDTETVDSQLNGYWIINAGSFTAPQIVDNRVLTITDPTLVKPGCKIRVSLTFFTYLKNDFVPSGVGCMLGNIQKAFTRNDYKILPDIDYENYLEEFSRITWK